jgi:hypothetical protein
MSVIESLSHVSHSAISTAWVRHLAYGIVQRCPYPLFKIDSWQVLEPEFRTKLFERLHANQFRARELAKVPGLTPVHRRNRRNFAQLHRDWNSRTLE